MDVDDQLFFHTFSRIHQISNEAESLMNSIDGRIKNINSCVENVVQQYEKIQIIQKRSKECLKITDDYIEKLDTLKHYCSLLKDINFNVHKMDEYFTWMTVVNEICTFFVPRASLNLDVLSGRKILETSLYQVETKFEDILIKWQSKEADLIESMMISIDSNKFEEDVYDPIRKPAENKNVFCQLKQLIKHILDSSQISTRYPNQFANIRNEFHKELQNRFMPSATKTPIPIEDDQKSIASRDSTILFSSKPNKNKTRNPADSSKGIKSDVSIFYSDVEQIDVNKFARRLLTICLISLENESEFYKLILPETTIKYINQRVMVPILEDYSQKIKAGNDRLKIDQNCPDMDELKRKLTVSLDIINLYCQYQQRILSCFDNSDEELVKSILNMMDEYERNVFILHKSCNTRIVEEINQEDMKIGFSGVFEFLEQIKSYFAILNMYQSCFAYISAKLVNKNLMYIQFDNSWFSYVNPISVTLIEQILNMIQKKCDVLEIPQAVVIAINNYEFIIDLLESGILINLTTMEFASMIKHESEFRVNILITRYEKAFKAELSSFVQLMADMKLIEKDQDNKWCKHFLSNHPKSKQEFKKLNEFIQKTVESHKKLSFYNTRVVSKLKNSLNNSLLVPYQEIYTFFKENDFSKKRWMTLGTSPVELSESITKLFT